jgi:hypothetical protein
MPQDFSKAKQPALKEGMVLPQDDVTVFATDKLAGLYPIGSEVVVHSAIGKKLVAAGKATEEAPKPAKAKD